jgi:general secretion pathway protein K
MKITPRSSSHGIALIVVMLAIFALAVLAGAFAYSMKVETKLAQNANNEANLYWLGRSGVEYCRWILAVQLTIPNEPYDALTQPWAGGPGDMNTTNSPLANLEKEVHMETGSFTWKITDLESKINVNTADQATLQQALTVVGVDASEIPSIADCILDWVGPARQPRINGAESDYYQSLDPPYYAKNGPIDDLSELLLVRGITPEMYWGTGSANHTPPAFKKADRFRGANEAPDYPVGLVELFTPMSSGKININTASAEVLKTVSPIIDDNIAGRILGVRSEGEGMAGPMAIGSPGKSILDALVSAGLSPGAAQSVAPRFTVRSNTFKVQVVAHSGGSSLTFDAIIGRNNLRDIQVLSFSWTESESK